MPFETCIIIIILSILSGMTTFIGVAMAVYSKKSEKGIVFSLSFAAGIMLLISIFELTPEAVQLVGVSKGLLTVMAGAIFFALFNIIIPHTNLIKETGRKNYRLLKMAYLVAFGLIIHDLPEGFAMANSFMISPGLGIFVAISIALHNIPEEFAIAMPWVALGEKKALYKFAFLSGLAEPAGAVLGLASITIAPGLIPYFVAFSAGAMIFVSWHELLPVACKYRQTNYLITGLISSIIIYWALHQFLTSI